MKDKNNTKMEIDNTSIFNEIFKCLELLSSRMDALSGRIDLTESRIKRMEDQK